MSRLRGRLSVSRNSLFCTVSMTIRNFICNVINLSSRSLFDTWISDTCHCFLQLAPTVDGWNHQTEPNKNNPVASIRRPDSTARVSHSMIARGPLWSWCSNASWLHDCLGISAGFLSITGLIISHLKHICTMPELVKRKKQCNPDAYLDEQDLKDIAESQEDIKMGRVYTHEEVRIRHGLRWSIPFLGQIGQIKNLANCHHSSPRGFLINLYQ